MEKILVGNTYNGWEVDEYKEILKIYTKRCDKISEYVAISLI